MKSKYSVLSKVTSLSLFPHTHAQAYAISLTHKHVLSHTHTNTYSMKQNTSRILIRTLATIFLSSVLRAWLEISDNVYTKTPYALHKDNFCEGLLLENNRQLVLNPSQNLSSLALSNHRLHLLWETGSLCAEPALTKTMTQVVAYTTDELMYRYFKVQDDYMDVYPLPSSHTQESHISHFTPSLPLPPFKN